MISVKAKQKIEENLDRIVDLAQKLIEGTEIYKKESKMEEAQFHNLLNIASSSDSIKALELFIQYQMGREKGDKTWQYKGPQATPFGEKLISDIENKLKGTAQEIGNREEERKIWLELVRLYIGYAGRYFTFKRDKEKREKSK